MNEKRQPVFVECSPCGERWKVATLPMDAAKFCKVMEGAACPNCGERRMLFMSKTDGPDAVTEPRAGKPMPVVAAAPARRRAKR